MIGRVSVDEHREAAPPSVRCFILTISDTRTPENDPSGDAIAEALTFVGHEVAGRTLVADDPAQVRSAVVLATLHADAIITTGGTGVTSRDSTYEALNALLERHLDGFGELFRMLSYSEVGAAAMLSRACAGTIGRTVVFSLPGATKAVQLALEKLIVPELPHIVRELRR
jgi:molybdenum cofactor biosynthesis protein B